MLRMLAVMLARQPPGVRGSTDADLVPGGGCKCASADWTPGVDAAGTDVVNYPSPAGANPQYNFKI